MTMYDFGYPKECTQCAPSKDIAGPKVAPYLANNGGARLMIIGQDPTIFKDPDRVKHVLMLDQEKGQLSRWLRTLIGHESFESLSVYATNLVKCSFATPPSTMREGGLKFLEPYFKRCKVYLYEEVSTFRPSCVLTLGEPAHKLFVSLLDNGDEIPLTMQGAFTGDFIKAKLKGHEFDYSPCLHIKTFRVAEVYGDSVRTFAGKVKGYFADSNSEAGDSA